MLDEDNLLRELPCFIIALMIHGVLLSADPGMRWTGAAAPKHVEAAIPVDFVAAVPAAPPPPPPVSVALAPVPPSPAKTEGVPQKGPGPLKPQQNVPAKTPAKSPIKQAGLKPPPGRPKRPAQPSPRQLQAEERRRAAARQRAQASAELRAENERIRDEKLRASRQAAAELSERRAEEARARQTELAAAREERRRAAAEMKAERARRRAEVSQQLATLADPDEKLSDAVADTPSQGPLAGSPNGRGNLETPLPAAPQTAAQLHDSAEPVYELEADGHDAKASPASGGGTGPDGGGLSWSLEGPAGGRRLLKRALPSSPDWVSQRGLELSVRVKFQVQPDGTVRPGSVIKSTSGFPEIDRRALEALKLWRFQAVPARAGPETWGIVTFRFLMG